MLQRHVRSLLERLDYAELAALPALSDDVSRYVSARASFVLGNYEDVTKKLAEIPRGLLTSLLEAQLAGTRLASIERRYETLRAIASGQVPSGYLSGERSFTLGVLAAQRGDYARSAAHFADAIGHYETDGLAGPAGMACFNLAVSAQHVRKPDLVRTAVDRMREHHTATGAPQLGMHLARLEGYEALHAENFALAAEHFGQALELCRALGRRRDLASTLSFLCYVEIKRGREEVAAAHARRHEHERGGDGYLWQRIDALIELGGMVFITADQARTLVQEWRENPSLDHNTEIMLLDLLCEALQRSQQYEGLLDVQRRGTEAAIQAKQAPDLIDFRRYGIVALIKLGRDRLARRLLTAYESDAREKGLRPRVARASELRSLMPTGEPIGPQASGVLYVTLDKARSRLIIGSSDHDLSLYPKLVEFFHVLLAEGGSVSIDALFVKLYDVPFHPDRHESRLTSLVHRARRLAAPDVTVVRRDGRVQLECASELRVTLSQDSGQALEERRETLLGCLRRSGGELTIRALEHELRWPRRTLQKYLKLLVDDNIVVKTGSTKKARYQCVESH